MKLGTAFCAAIVAAGLAGCKGEDLRLRSLEHDNALRVEPSSTPGADYVVTLRNLIDIGYNPDDKPTRDAVALRTLREQCPRGQVVGETVIATGTYLDGRPSRTYSMRIKC